MNVPLATPARQRLCRLLVPMVWNESIRDSSPNSSMVLSSKGSIALAANGRCRHSVDHLVVLPSVGVIAMGSLPLV